MPLFHIAIAVIVTMLSFALPAVEFECSLGSDRRSIRLEYPGQNHLCEVSVTSAELGRSVKWYADNEPTFCSKKIYELVDKYVDEWHYTCLSLPESSDITSLSTRHRGILDATIETVTEEGIAASIPFIVTDAQAHSVALTDDANTALVIQLFIETSDATVKSDRTYFYIDDGDHYSTTAVFAGLRQNIALLDESYKVNSAVVSAVYPTGEIEVKTTLFSLEDDAASEPRCFGSQLFRPNAGGTLDPVNEHHYSCNL